MPLQTTVIGAWPKPEACELRDWFMNKQHEHSPATYRKQLDELGQDKLTHILESVITEQKQLGLDVITDGEVARDSYVFHYCRQLEGIDCDNPEVVRYRNGALHASLPVIRSEIQARPTSAGEQRQSVQEWRQAQQLAGTTPVKYTLPGPLTICGTTKDAFYASSAEAAAACALCLKQEVQALAAAGCTHLQIDEPVLMREPHNARQYGFRLLDEILEGLNPAVHTTLHLCCGYPCYLDQEEYLKADNRLYEDLAPFLNESKYDAISIEDTHERIADMGGLFTRLDRKQIVLGSVAVARSRVESVTEIVTRLRHALQHVSPERLIVSPDCGLGFLPRDVMYAKLRNMLEAAKQLP